MSRRRGMVTLGTGLNGRDNTMSINHENIVHHNAPTPEQLHKLASIGAGSAAARQRLKQMSRTKRAHFFIDEIDLLDTSAFDAEELSQIRHRMAGRVGVKESADGSPKTWSLKYYDTYWVEHEAGQWLGERTLYRFEWDRLRTNMAERTFRLIGLDRPECDLSDYIDHFTVRDDTPDILYAQQQIETVSIEDCAELINNAGEYYQKIDMLYGRAA